MSLTEVQIYDESSWNEIAKIDSNPYAFAKVCVTSLAVARGFSRQSIQCSEQESNANKFLNQLPEAERFDLVFLNPTTVLGPLLTRELRSTSEIVYHLMAGNLPLVPHWGTGGAPHRSLHTHLHFWFRFSRHAQSWMCATWRVLWWQHSSGPTYRVGTFSMAAAPGSSTWPRNSLPSSRRMSHASCDDVCFCPSLPFASISSHR